MITKISTFITATRWRSAASVRHHLPERIKTDFKMTSRLRRYDHTHFGGIVSLVERALKINSRLAKLVVDIPERVPALDDVNFQMVTEEVLETCIRGNTLDLRGIHLRLQGYQAHIDHESAKPQFFRPQYEQVEELVEVLVTARETFRELPETTAAPQVFATINRIIKLLKFRNIAIYAPGGDGRWAREFVSTSWALNGTKYDPAAGGAIPTTTLKSVIEGNKSVYLVDIRDLHTFTIQGLIPDPASIQNDLEASHGPSEMIFLKVFSPLTGELIGVVQINNRTEPGQPAPEALLPNDLHAARKMLTLLETIFDEAALALERTRLTTTRKSFPSRRVLPPAGQSFNLFKFIRNITVPRPYGQYQVASIIGPSKLSASNISGIVQAIDWMDRGERDMQEHAIYVDETRFAFDERGEVVAFASINSLPYVYQTPSGRMWEGSVIPLIGTAVRAGHRRQGLQVSLNFELILKRWLQQKFNWRTIFKPLRVAVRTYNPAVMATLYTHFRHIKFKDLSVEEQAARDAFADHLKCKVDANGIVRNAYDEPLPDQSNGLSLKGNIKSRVLAAQADLGSRDARIFILKYGLIDILKTVLWLSYKGIERWRSKE